MSYIMSYSMHTADIFHRKFQFENNFNITIHFLKVLFCYHVTVSELITTKNVSYFEILGKS